MQPPMAPKVPVELEVQPMVLDVSDGPLNEIVLNCRGHFTDTGALLGTRLCGLFEEIAKSLGALGVQFLQGASNFVISFICQWSVKKCKETNSTVYGSSFPRSFLNYMTQPSTTQVLAIPARSERSGLFLTHNDWT